MGVPEPLPDIEWTTERLVARAVRKGRIRADQPVITKRYHDGRQVEVVVELINLNHAWAEGLWVPTVELRGHLRTVPSRSTSTAFGPSNWLDAAGWVHRIAERHAPPAWPMMRGAAGGL